MIDKTLIKPYKKLDLKIYGYTLPEVPSHKGYVKIGETNRSVEKRINEQVGTIGLTPEILFKKQAKKSDGTWFHDRDLHKFLLLNGVKRNDFNGAEEWFFFNGYPEKAEYLTEKFINNDYDEIQISDEKYEYILRSEQQKAVEKTYEYYSSDADSKEFLWNAKPRFGKTLTTYDFVRKIQAKNILIVTNRPAIANSWYEDFVKFISWQEPNLKFISETDALKDKAMTRKDYVDYVNSNELINPSQISFISLQDLKGAKFAGGIFEKLEWVSNLKWDLLVIDEAHEGVDTIKTDQAFKKIQSDFTLHLSGTPFKALASNKFTEEQIYNWSYVDEQEAKAEWDYSIGSNPYENLPNLSLFTYQMSKLIEDELSEGLTLSDDNNVDYAFDLNEFFKVKDNGKFEYEDSVEMFLNNLSSGKYPFSSEKHRNELDHTFWVLPRVNSAKALEKLLKEHEVFKNYKVILAAGDGISLNEDLEEKIDDFRSNEKSYDRVKKAIKENEKTITLSVGQLTTGVTIPEWSAVLMLNNIKSPSLYFQAAFRAQNPYEFKENGNLFRKESAYIFDFAPERTLNLYDELANNLSMSQYKSTDERKNKISKLLNFFPVIGEDEDGEMHELNATEVLTIPKRITSKEVVKRGFMSNLLFSNISGIFSGDSPFKEILDKIPPEKNKKLKENKEINITDPLIDEDGNIDIPEEIVINKSKDIFGEKIFVLSEENIDAEKVSTEINDLLDDRFDRLRNIYEVNKTQADKLSKETKNKTHEIINENESKYNQRKEEIEQEYEEEIQKAKRENNSKKINLIEAEFKNEKYNIRQEFEDNVNKHVSNIFEEVVEKQIIKKEEQKKKSTEDDVRDHLRGFSRTIPSFLMAYGDEDTKLANFEKNIDQDTFLELTSITIEEFKFLRDGFEFTNDKGENKKVEGLFNELVFNGSIVEFLETKKRLSNYFEPGIKEDIFDYIPPQKTNQIFTPKNVVIKMVDLLEKESPDIFKDKNIVFVDLYAKSGIYITEIVKRLNIGLRKEIPQDSERIKWILENQIFAFAPNNIIYNIVRNYIFGIHDEKKLSFENIYEIDTLSLVSNDNLYKEMCSIFGDDQLKFNVIIGNPPYQDETIGDNKTFAPPIYHKFLDESYLLGEKVMMIHPARFLFNAGSTPKKWNKKMLSDKHLKIVDYNSNSIEIFPNTDIKGGIAISYRDEDKDFGAIGVFSRHSELNEVINKIKTDEFSSMSDLIFAKDSYRFTEKLHSDYPEARKLLSSSHEYDVASNIFEKLDFIFSNYSQSEDNTIKVYGRKNGSRVGLFIKEEYIKNHNNLNKYKVIMPGANGSGDFGEVIVNPFVAEPKEGHTATFISVGAFETKKEAINTLKYVKTKFARAILGILKVTPRNGRTSWELVPQQNFDSNLDINWSKTISEIDQQLYKKYGLSQEEKEFIEINVQPMI